MFALFVFVVALGVVGGFLAGTLGLGGGIVLAPLLLLVPPLFGHAALDMPTVAGLTMIQSLCATSAAALAHHRQGTVCWELVRWMGGAIGLSSLMGALLAPRVPSQEQVLRGLFAVLAVLAASLMWIQPRAPSAEPTAPTSSA
ncbi:MAG: sulfite exporter TauE/SafE family protein, partial [Planctomycetes bacterium]|nr:sulfite exporter TauE/SafE family protein [Planctomycetota bacterium]